MSILFWFLMVFIMWIIKEIIKKQKKEYTYPLLMHKSNYPDIRDKDRGLRKWVGVGTIIFIVVFIVTFYWAYKISNEPTYREQQRFEMHHKRTMGLNHITY